MKDKSIKLKLNPKKFITVVLFGIGLISCLNLGIKVTATNYLSTNEKIAYIEVLVKNGDSLWNLTETYYNGSDDIRKVIYQVKKMNNLTNVNLIPGQMLRIPKY